MLLRCASYNIHRCYGRDGRHDPERIRRVLREMDAEVIALQEVELLHDAPDLLDYLRAGHGWQAIAGPTLERADGHYGNALLTRLPVIDVRFRDLSVPGREPRGAIRARLDCHGRRVSLIATHLGLMPRERRMQVRALLALIQEECREDDLTVLLGDLNEWFLWGRPLRWLHRHFRDTPAPASFPARWPLFALDRIWVTPRPRLRSVRTWKTGLSRVASDHLPLYAGIEC